MSHEFGPQSVSGTPPRMPHETDETGAVFGALTHEYRRETVRYLIDADGPVDEADLYVHVAAQFDVECDWTDPITYVAIQFHHCHRPKLEAADIAEFDDEAETIELGDRSHRAAAKLEQFGD
jgi:hypothetical protein